MTEHLYPTESAIDSVVVVQGPEGAFGSGFVVTRGEENFLVTAAHNIGGGIESELIVTPRGGKPVRKVFRRLGPVSTSEADDVAVLPLKEQMTAHSILLGVAGFRLAQDVLVLGYPTDVPLSVAAGKTPAAAFPMVKKASVAGVNTREPGLGMGDSDIWIDQAANPGFSGGPVLFRDDDGALRALGMVLASATERTGNRESNIRVYSDLTLLAPAKTIFAHITAARMLE